MTVEPSKTSWARKHLVALATWAAGVIGTLLAVWFDKEFVVSCFSRTLEWLAGPSGMPTWLALLAGAILAVHLLLGLRRVIAGQAIRGAPPAWTVFDKGMFHSGLWSWRYCEDGSLLDAHFVCPFDETPMAHSHDNHTQMHLSQDESRDVRDGRASCLKCPACGAICLLGELLGSNIRNIIKAEIRTGRWQQHSAELSERIRLLQEAVGGSREWIADVSIAENAGRPPF